MKITMFVFVTIMASQAFATMEHQAGFESKPSAERLSKSRGCFAEIEAHGCQHPREGQEKFNTCMREKITELKPSCQAFFEKLYGDKSKKQI